MENQSLTEKSSRKTPPHEDPQESVERKLSLSGRENVLVFSIMTSVAMTGLQLLHYYIHEMLGHAVIGLLVGQHLNGFYISPFGASFTFISVSTSPAVAALQYAAGTLVSVPLGIFLLFWLYPAVKRRDSSFGVRFLLLIFIIMLESDLLYGFSSPLIQFGDIYRITAVFSIQPSVLLSIALFPVILVVYYPILREYFELLVPFTGKGEQGRLLNDGKARATLLLKATYLPVLFVLLEQFAAIGIFSVSAGLFFVIAIAVLVSPLLPAIYVASWVPPKLAIIREASNAEARSAFNELLRYTLGYLVFMLATEAVFGPVPRIVNV
jgi:hypothetical protein